MKRTLRLKGIGRRKRMRLWSEQERNWRRTRGHARPTMRAS